MLLQDFLIDSVQRFPDKEAIVHGKSRYTYDAVYRAAFTLACWLAERDFPPGFRATILTDDPFEYITSYFATMFAGGIAVGLNTQTSERTLTTVCNDCTPAILFAHTKYHKYLIKVVSGLFSPLVTVFGGAEKVPEIPGTKVFGRAALLGDRQCLSKDRFPLIGPNGVAQIIYTSGTTGEPKGVMLSHENLIANTYSIVRYLGLSEQDKVMAVLPFFYSYGNSIFLTHFAVGGTLVVNQSFLYPSVILDEMAEEKVTGFSGVPSTYAILLNRSAIRNYHFPALRYCTQAGAAMSPKLAHQLKEIVPGADIFIMYGQTEASARLSYLPPADIYRKAGSIGKAIPGVTLKLLNPEGNPVRKGEVGEIVALGQNIMAGYWKKPEETARVLRAEGLWTGDLARMDDEGYFYIVSRKSEMIKSGSHRIAPKEIEEIIHEHEAVYEAAVVGCEDEILGESIKACIVLKSDTPCSEKEILVHCRRNLPAFKVPHKVEFYEELPKTATGKIKKQDLTKR